MINRRHLRIKVLQALYGWFQSGDESIKPHENGMMVSTEKIYDLYLYHLALLMDIHFEALKEREEVKNKYFPTEQDLKPKTNFTSNRFLVGLMSSELLKSTLQKKKISWEPYFDLVKQMWRKLRNTDYYQDYLKLENPDLQQDKDFITWFALEMLANDDLVLSQYEEINIHWVDDLYLVCGALMKTIKEFSNPPGYKLPELYKEEQEDTEFMVNLFRKTALRTKEYEEMIQHQAQNWELERIAMMDIILMKMAICEVLEFPEVPVKVTLNEYIEISKSFSTPKSNVFINGILDKLVAKFKAEGRMKKTGRGLIEN